MKIKLKKISLENYKCFGERCEFDFHEKTEISGRNRSGKSTIENAYLETLTGKELSGSSPSGIRPHNEDGTDANRADIIREIHLEIDGKHTVIKKRTYQKWRKPHGQTEEVFDGNGEDFEVDGFPYKPNKFKEFIATIADPDVLLMCSNANPFLATLQKSTAEGRKILEKMAGFDVEDFIAANPQYSDIAGLTKGHSIEDTAKKLRKGSAEQKKKMEAQNQKIKHEQARPLTVSENDLEAMFATKAELESKLAGIEAQERELEEAVKAYDKTQAEILSLKNKASEMKGAWEREVNEKKAAYIKEVNDLTAKQLEVEGTIKNLTFEQTMVEKEIKRLETEIAQAREEYGRIRSGDIDESRLRAIEAEEFDEEALVCPTCGQTLPEGKARQVIEGFEAHKQRRIQDEKRRLAELQEDLDARSQEIETRGNAIAEQLQQKLKRRNVIGDTLSNEKMKYASYSHEIEVADGKLNSVAVDVEEPDFSDLNNKIKEMEARLATLDSGAERRMELRQERNACTAELIKVKSELQAAKSEQENKERILQELQVELRKIAQVQADIERQIDMLSDFSREKNAALAEKINPYMEGFEFRFLTYTIEKNPTETCQIWRNGVEFSGLNYSDRLIVQASMLRGFQRMNNLDLPIWIDNSESVNTERIPELDTQMIVLRVTDEELEANGIV